jgi:hypothetical protein
VRNAALRLQDQRTVYEHRQMLRSAVRQVERAETYLEAVAHMDLGDGAVQGAIIGLRADLARLRGHLAERRTKIR